MKLLETLISLQGITIYIYVCNLREVILFLFGTINFTTKDWLTSLDWFLLHCGLIRTRLKGTGCDP